MNETDVMILALGIVLILGGLGGLFNLFIDKVVSPWLDNYNPPWMQRLNEWYNK